MRSVAVLWSIVVALLVCLPTVRADESPLGAHPHFDDQGAVRWARSFDEAKRAAATERKLLFVEYGRAACSNCRTLAERTLPHERVGPRLSELAVGFAAECDPPLRDDALVALFREHLPKAKTLPFVAMLNEKGEWIAGFSGYADVERFVAFLDETEASPMLRATPEVEEELDRLLVRATKAEAKGDWRGVFKAVAASHELRGKSPIRAAIDEVALRGHAWATGRLRELVQTLADGDRGLVRRELRKLDKVLRDHPLEVEVDAGLEAAKLHAKVESATDEARRDELRKAAFEELADTMWAVLFAPPKPAAEGDDSSDAE